jgi:hypothetical protein
MIHVFLLICGSMVAADEQPKPVAMVLTVKGEATLQRGDQKAEPLREMTLVMPGDLVTGADAVRVVFFTDGHVEAIKPKTKATAAAEGFSPADAVEVQPKKLKGEQIRNLRDYAATSRAGVGVPRGPTVRAGSLPGNPPSGCAVLKVRPTLRWEAVAKATAYIVELRDESGKVLWRETVKNPELVYPERRRPLEYSGSYQWKVTAKMPQEEDDRAFEANILLVVTESELKELEALKPLTDSKDPADWLLAALSYEAHGVFAEALALYEKLAQQAPDQAKYHQTLATYYDRAGRIDDATRERAKAKKLGLVEPQN